MGLDVGRVRSDNVDTTLIFKYERIITLIPSFSNVHHTLPQVHERILVECERVFPPQSALLEHERLSNIVSSHSIHGFYLTCSIRSI